MSTQYDHIGGKYQDAKLAPGARLEEHNLRVTLEPHVRGATVLDLACGTGHYSRKLIEWGAHSVMGVDVSQKMIEFAEDSLTLDQRERVTFRVADCAVPTLYSSSPFDIVLGSWFLNYAADATELTQMFRNIRQNLKPGGLFVGVCPQPTDDLHAYFRKLESKPKEKFGFDARIKHDVADGVVVHVSIYPPDSPAVEIENYCLRQDVWRKAAKEGGMSGALEWPALEVPVMIDLGKDYWSGCEEYPPFAILIIRTTV